MRIGTVTKSVNITPSSVDTSHYSAALSSNTTYGYTAHTSDICAGIKLKNGSNAETYRYFKFDTSEIPQDATIISVSCQAKANISVTTASVVATKYLQMAYGTTLKGSPSNFTSTSVTTFDLSCGSWTRAELDNIGIKVYAKRGTSQTSSAVYIYFYGATLTVQYSYQATLYSLSLTNNSSYSATLTETEVEAGETARLIVPDLDENIIVKDNGANINNDFVEYDYFTSTSTPASYTTGGNTMSGTNYQGAIGKEAIYDNSDASTGNDYVTQSGSGTCYVEYSFNFSSIPSDAIVENVKVLVLGHLQSTSQSTEKAELQLYSGSTTKGSVISFTTSAPRIIEMPTTTWTRSELTNAKLRFTMGHYGGAVQGVSFIVTYRDTASKRYLMTNISGDHVFVITNASADSILYTKINGSWVGVTTAYVKQNGSWVEVADLTTLFDSNNQYIQGNIS